MDCLVAESRSERADESDPQSRRVGIAAAAASAILIVDQVTKTWAQSDLADGRLQDVVGPLHFRLVHNSGSAFGIGNGLGPFIAVVAVMAAGGLLWYSRKIVSIPCLVALGTITGGALGNFLDRAFRNEPGFLSGAVVDFIDLTWWPVFNIADMAIALGGVAFVLLASRTAS